VTAPDPVDPPVTTPDPIPEAVSPQLDPAVVALVAQVQEMQRQIAKMNEERGIPANPIGAAVKDLIAHVKARLASGLPHYQELDDAVHKFEETPTSAQTDLARTVASEIPAQVEGAAYVHALANNLHKLVLAQ
jgi:hypothetical protein